MDNQDKPAMRIVEIAVAFAAEVVFPELNVKKDMSLNKPVEVHVSTERTRTLTFPCGTGMLKGALVIG